MLILLNDVRQSVHGDGDVPQMAPRDSIVFVNLPWLCMTTLNVMFRTEQLGFDTFTAV